MADNRTMEELLQAPMEGYGEAIIIPEINTDHFEIKTNLLQLERFKEILRACPHHGFTVLTQIDTFYNGLNENDQDSLNAAAGRNLLNKTTRETLQIIKSKSKVRYSRNKPNVSRMNMNSREISGKTDDRIDKLANQISTLVDIVSKKVVTPATVKVVEESCVTCGAIKTNDQMMRNMQSQLNSLKGEFKNEIQNTMKTQQTVLMEQQNAFQNNLQNMLSGFFQNQISTSERETEETTDKEQTNFQGSIAHIQPPVVLILKPDVLKTLPKPNIPYPSRLNDQKLCKKATNQMEKFFHIFQDLHFDITKIPLNENCSVILLKKLPEKLRDPGKFLIPRDFPRMNVCHALADLGASINRMPLSIWKNLSLPKLVPTRMTLELADQSITRPKGVAEDVFIKLGKFHFPTDFVVVDFEVDPRVPLILGRSFLRTGRALIDVYREEITLRVNDEAVTFNLNQTSDNISGGNPTSTFEPIIFDTFPSLTLFEGSGFILEEIKAYLKDESISPKINHAGCDPEGDICLIEKLLNDDPFQLPLMDLKKGEVVKAKYSIEEPSELELKDLPSHLEYAYLEGADKLPVIIVKYLKVDEKESLLKVLKYHKRAIAWKITDIKGIDPRFCTHKILTEEDYKPVVQSQRRVNLKIHEVIKKEVIKLLDAGMIYPISDSSWVSPIHCVPKIGGITVVENENNELIPTRLVTAWRVCIDYRKLNDATSKYHFPLPFMDQMLE
nr:reverse transcriptase domain-containing protein [Tanacetum cinerariifolium]